MVMVMVIALHQSRIQQKQQPDERTLEDDYDAELIDLWSMLDHDTVWMVGVNIYPKENGLPLPSALY
jgi:predicted thioredoxin/glutaredoxin